MNKINKHDKKVLSKMFLGSGLAFQDLMLLKCKAMALQIQWDQHLKTFFRMIQQLGETPWIGQTEYSILIIRHLAYLEVLPML